MTEPPRQTPTVACDEAGCANPAATVIGVGRRRFGRQRLDVVRLLCRDHAARFRRRRLLELGIEEWLKADLSDFQRRWHRPAELAEYIRTRFGH